MSEPDLPIPEPTERDEELALAFMRTKDETGLRGFPSSDGASPEGGDQRCDNCHFYSDTSQEISYCWHDKLEIMVGGSWWCDRWEAVGESDEVMSHEDVVESKKQWYTLVEDNQWVAQPKFGEQCNACLYYLDPDASVSYCWHPKLQVGVGHDHWCTWWEEIPGDQ